MDLIIVAFFHFKINYQFIWYYNFLFNLLFVISLLAYNLKLDILIESLIF